MRQQRIPLLTTEEFSRFPDQTVEILNRLIAEVNQYQADKTEISNAILSLRKQVKNISPLPPSPTPTGEWQQVLAFYPGDMGNTPGLCLKNVMAGFHISEWASGIGSAYEDMLWNRNNGTLHEGTPPADVAVPVYMGSGTIYGHVAAWDHGVVYSDGEIVPEGLSHWTVVYGWGEYCDGVRVVAPVQ